MILKGSQRSGAARLSRHLMNARDNEHVELHDLRGFACEDDLHGALLEAEAIAKGTRCKQYLFSLSLNPPEDETVDIATYETAIEMIEQKLGLDGQPRAIVFHEKEGRRHAHAVWSRIDTESMTAIPLPFFKTKLMDVSRELYLEQGWDMPKGLIDQSLRNPLNFTRAEWQHAQRMKQDPRLIKAAFRECWARSDTRQAFAQALEERGYFLAKGDRRGLVALDIHGEIYAVARWAGVKTKDVRGRLGDPKDLPSVHDTRDRIAVRMNEKLQGFVKEVRDGYRRLAPSAEFKRKEMVTRHRADRAMLAEQQSDRSAEEERNRAARLPKGLGGLWSRITGRYGKIRRHNEYETLMAQRRDEAEKDALIASQLEERRDLQKSIAALRARRTIEISDLQAGIASELSMSRDHPDERTASELHRSRAHSREKCQRSDHDLEL